MLTSLLFYLIIALKSPRKQNDNSVCLKVKVLYSNMFASYFLKTQNYLFEQQKTL